MRANALVLILVVALAGGAVWYFTRDTRLPEERAQELRDEATALMDKEKYREAVEPLRKCIELEDGRNALSLSLLAICHMELGEFADAKRQIEKALQLDPNDGCMRVIYAKVLLNLATDETAGWQAANAELNKLTPKARQSPYVAYNLAILYARHRRPQLALRFLSYAIEKDPRNRSKAREDEAFESLRDSPEFQRLVR